MLTNAMWYSGAEDNDNQDNLTSDSSSTNSVVFRIGIVEITYRFLFVVNLILNEDFWALNEKNKP